MSDHEALGAVGVVSVVKTRPRTRRGSQTGTPHLAAGRQAPGPMCDGTTPTRPLTRRG